MQTATAAFGTVVTSNDVVTAFRVLITFPSGVTYSDASLTVSDVGVDRQLVTDMPGGTRLVAGYPSAQLSLTLSGTLDPTDETKSIAWLMGHYQTTSPLYRRDCKGIAITVDAGVLDGANGTTSPFEGVEFVRNFTGTIDDYTVDQQAGTVTITALDGRSKLSTATQLPSAFGPAPAFPYLMPVTSEWVLDALIRPSFLTWPALRSKAVLAASMRGCNYPNLGSVSPDTATGIGILAKGKFGSSVQAVNPVGGPPFIYNFAAPLAPPAGGIFCECWIASGSVVDESFGVINISDATAGNMITGSVDAVHQAVIVGITNGAFFESHSFTSPTVVANTIYYFAFSLVGTTLRINFNGTVQTFTAVASAATATNPLTTVSVQAQSIEALQITNEGGTPAFNDAFAPTAVMDPSLNTLVAIPDTGGQDVWGVVQQIADAEQGVAGLDELGVFRFRNRNTLAKAASVRTISADQSLATIQTETSMAGYANHVTAPISGLTIGPLAWVWVPSEVPRVPPMGTWTQVVSTDHPVVALALTDSGICPANQAPDGHTYWRACLAPDGAGAEVHYGITITCTQLSSASIRVTATSTRTVPVYLVTPIGVGYPGTSQGQPALFLGGQFVLDSGQPADSTTDTTSSSAVADAQWPPLVPDGGAVTNPLREHLLALSDNPWRQDAGSTQQLVIDVLNDLCSRRPLWTNVKIMHDPRLQLGDRVTLSDPNVTGMASEDAFIYSIQVADDWTATLDLRPIGAPGGWLLNQAGRSELNGTIYI